MRDLLNCGFVCARTMGFRVEHDRARVTSLARDKWLLLALEAGQLLVKSRDWELEIKGGEIAVLPPARRITFCADRGAVDLLRMPMHCLNAGYLPSQPLKRLSLPQAISHRKPSRFSEILQRVVEITNDQAHAKDRASRLMGNALLNELLMEFIVAGFESGVFKSWDQSIPSWLEKARTILEKNMRVHDFTIADVAEELGVSEGHLYRQFKMVFGKTPRQYLIEYRMEMACQLLTTRPEITVDAVMRRLGYQAPSEFIAAFKKYTGKHPGAFRGG